MNSEITVFAPAKVNLFLEVLGKRPDGYHEIDTLFAKISLGDDIKISVEPANEIKISLKMRGPYGANLKEDKTNLVYKAALAFFDYFEIKAKCEIRVEKNIPLGAGLGGGSSDAASVLLGLCSLYSIELNSKRMKDLNKIGAKLGADVPVFLEKGTFFRAQGIGEKLTLIKSDIKSPALVIVYPKISSDTATAYKEAKINSDKKKLTNISNLNKIVEDVKKACPMAIWGGLIYNKLEDGVLSRLDVIKETKEQLKALGADFVLMSGSGSSVIGFVQDESKAQEIAKKIKDKDVFLAHFWRA
ncbi:MAG: 4-(cytidine 5'-diphospho)-2-C-methyl-D-erythritol kinase [Elusimicrobiaceae bacterium]|nr:4-(cytidine 5'-diphospho)-2-C-methyl-D-erythritol kinase [Elusimicrobiaceae bacterium]